MLKRAWHCPQPQAKYAPHSNNQALPQTSKERTQTLREKPTKLQHNQTAGKIVFSSES